MASCNWVAINYYCAGATDALTAWLEDVMDQHGVPMAQVDADISKVDGEEDPTIDDPKKGEVNTKSGADGLRLYHLHTARRNIDLRNKDRQQSTLQTCRRSQHRFANAAHALTRDTTLRCGQRGRPRPSRCQQSQGQLLMSVWARSE